MGVVGHSRRPLLRLESRNGVLIVERRAAGAFVERNAEPLAGEVLISTERRLEDDSKAKRRDHPRQMLGTQIARHVEVQDDVFQKVFERVEPETRFRRPYNAEKMNQQKAANQQIDQI